MIKRMKHPYHGFTHVYDSGQEAQIRVHGWVEENESFPGQEEAAPLAEISPKTEERKKPGRKPRTN